MAYNLADRLKQANGAGFPEPSVVTASAAVPAPAAQEASAAPEVVPTALAPADAEPTTMPKAEQPAPEAPIIVGPDVDLSDRKTRVALVGKVVENTPGTIEFAKLLRDPLVQKVRDQVREILSEVRELDKEERERRLFLLADAQAGDKQAEKEIRAMIERVLAEHRLSVPGVPTERLIDAIFESCWGLDVLAPIYQDERVEEIRVNNHRQIYTVRGGLPFQEPISFTSPEQVRTIIRRILLADRQDITRDQPRVETTRKDGARVTAAAPPFTRYPTLVIRKFNTLILKEETFLKNRTFNERMARLMKALVRGRASIMISGGTGTGKTTLLRLLVGYLPPHLRIVTLESDFELNLERYYPERDILALEAHPELDPPLTLAEAFKTVLRLTPDVIILGEARAGEAEEMVKAAMRGHDGSMGTAHVSSVRECVEAVCNMILEERPHRPIDVLRAQVASAFQIIIQMVRWPSGWKMIEEICEIYYDHDERKIVFNPLVKWRGSDTDPEDGDWEFPNPPSPRLVERLKRGGVPPAELKEAGILW